MITADTITIDNDEGRITLVVTTDDGAVLTFDIHGIALEFYATVKRDLGPYVHEADQARAAVARGESLEQYLGGVDDDADGYSPDDPKSPGYFDRMVG